jgi:hypothetical protein
MLSYFSKQGQISELMLSIQGRICDMLLFSYVAEYVSFYFAMKEKSWFNTFDTADLVLFDFSLYEAKFVLFDSSRQGRITSLFIMSH